MVRSGEYTFYVGRGGEYRFYTATDVCFPVACLNFTHGFAANRRMCKVHISDSQ